MANDDLPKLLRVIANGSQAKDNKHDVIFNSAANEIECLRNDFAALQHALVGNTGLSAIQEAIRLRKLHPLSSAGKG